MRQINFMDEARLCKRVEPNYVAIKTIKYTK